MNAKKTRNMMEIYREAREKMDPEDLKTRVVTVEKNGKKYEIEVTLDLEGKIVKVEVEEETDDDDENEDDEDEEETVKE